MRRGCGDGSPASMANNANETAGTAHRKRPRDHNRSSAQQVGLRRTSDRLPCRDSPPQQAAQQRVQGRRDTPTHRPPPPHFARGRRRYSVSTLDAIEHTNMLTVTRRCPTLRARWIFISRLSATTYRHVWARSTLLASARTCVLHPTRPALVTLADRWTDSRVVGEMAGAAPVRAAPARCSAAAHINRVVAQ